MTIETYIGLFTSYVMRKIPESEISWHQSSQEHVAVTVFVAVDGARDSIMCKTEKAKLEIEPALFDIAGRDAYQLVRKIERAAEKLQAESRRTGVYQ